MREKDSFALAVQTMRLREKKRRLRLWAGRALLMLFIAWLLSFVFGIFVVQGDSMRPAYQDGDLVFMIRVLPKGVTYDNVPFYPLHKSRLDETEQIPYLQF